MSARFDARGARACAFIALAVVIIAGPAWRQVFGGDSDWLRSWMMYRNNGSNIVTFQFERLHDGRWEAFDVETTVKANLRLRPGRPLRLDNVAAFEQIKVIVCRAFPARTLRVSARQGDPKTGWRTLAEQEPLACPKRR